MSAQTACHRWQHRETPQWRPPTPSSCFIITVYILIQEAPLGHGCSQRRGRTSEPVRRSSVGTRSWHVVACADATRLSHTCLLTDVALRMTGRHRRRHFNPPHLIQASKLARSDFIVFVEFQRIRVVSFIAAPNKRFGCTRVLIIIIGVMVIIIIIIPPPSSSC